MVLGDCIPVRSPQDIRAVEAVPSVCVSPNSRWRLRSNEKAECVFYIKEKSNKIKQFKFFVTTLMYSSVTEAVKEVYLHNLGAEWFLYLLPGRFYSLIGSLRESDSPIVDLNDAVGEVSFSDLTENHENVNLTNVQKMNEIKKLIQDQRTMVSFSDITQSRSSSLFVSVEAEVVGMSSFEKSGFITFADTHKNMENIAFTPARRTLPKFLIPGSRVVMHQLFMKTIRNGTKRFLSVTHMTQIYLLSLPTSTISLTQTSLLNDCRTLQKSHLVSLIVEVDCILSLSVNTAHNISCRLSVRDVSDSATLHVKDNLELVRELFVLKEDEEQELARVRNMQFGKIDRKENSGVLQIFSRILQSGTRYYIKAEVRMDSVQYLVQTQFGKLPKCPRIHIFPYLIKALSPVDELAAICEDARSTLDEVADFMDPLPPETIGSIYEFYRMDFDILGYTKMDHPMFPYIALT
ncbi:hypothetical protein ACHWQZ_G008999 [Mnemiopsis leidyi]